MAFPNLSKDVRAGPIYDKNEAEAKARMVEQGMDGCTWNGHWTTTVPNAMSVVGMRRRVLHVTITAHGSAYTNTPQQTLPEGVELRMYVKHKEILEVSRAQALWNQLVDNNLEEYRQNECKQRYFHGSHHDYFLSPENTWDNFQAAVYIHKPMVGRGHVMWFPLRNAQSYNHGERGCYLSTLMTEIMRRANDHGHNGDICVHFLCCREV